MMGVVNFSLQYINGLEILSYDMLIDNKLILESHAILYVF
jgi:hypothetical protein